MRTLIILTTLFLLASTSLLIGRNYEAGMRKDSLAISTTAIRMPVVVEEGYINDIPFDTRLVSIKSLYRGLERPETEAFINDIPFSTETSAVFYTYTMQEIQVEEEMYIDDIPFNTLDVAKKYESGFASNFAYELEKRKCDN